MELSRRLCLALLVLISITWSTDAAITDVRLVSGSSAGEGRVEVQYDGVWGTVCHNKNIKFLQKEAKVVCRTLGFNGTFSRVFSTSNYTAFGKGDGSSLNLTCNDTVASITECWYTIEEGQCAQHKSDVGVICYREPTRNAANDDVRLVGGAQPNEGRVEIFHGDQWKRVSGDSFFWKDAHVVCRTLGFESAFALISSEAFGQGSGPVISLNCFPRNRTVSDCFPPESSNETDRYAGVVCIHDRYTGYNFTTEQPTLGLSGPSSNASRGRVEVYYEGQLGTVCGRVQNLHAPQGNSAKNRKRFSNKEAKALCREMGFESSSRSGISETEYGNSSGPVLLAVNCAFDATGLEECDSNWGPTSACISDYDPWVECSGMNECSPNSCLNGGTCNDGENGYNCTCAFGFWGHRCEFADDYQGILDALVEVKDSINHVISIIPEGAIIMF